MRNRVSIVAKINGGCNQEDKWEHNSNICFVLNEALMKRTLTKTLWF